MADLTGARVLIYVLELHPPYSLQRNDDYSYMLMVYRGLTPMMGTYVVYKIYVSLERGVTLKNLFSRALNRTHFSSQTIFDNNSVLYISPGQLKLF